MKTCPQCGSAFTNDFIYCDKDGTPLESGSRKRGWLVLGALLAAIAVAAALYLDRYILSKITADVTGASVQFDPVGGISPLDHLHLMVNVRAHNSSFLSVSLRSATFGCLAGGEKVAALSWPSQGEPPVEIASGGSADVSFRLNAVWPATFNPFDTSRQKVDGDCQGAVHFSARGIGMTRHLSFKKELW